MSRPASAQGKALLFQGAKNGAHVRRSKRQQVCHLSYRRDHRLKAGVYVVLRGSSKSNRADYPLRFRVNWRTDGGQAIKQFIESCGVPFGRYLADFVEQTVTINDRRS